jgi:hypothetical protein
MAEADLAWWDAAARDIGDLLALSQQHPHTGGVALHEAMHGRYTDKAGKPHCGVAEWAADFRNKETP